MPSKIDLLNKRFGRLKVLSENPSAYNHKCKKLVWNCICDCGNKTLAYGDNLRNGNTKSCGCFQKYRIAEVRFKHGRSNSSIYNTWRDIQIRCYNKKDKSYKNYGGRGIRVCRKWRGSSGFVNFLEDMGERPKGLSLERTNNNKGYNPRNCRWATTKEQNSNKRNTTKIFYQGKLQPIAFVALKINKSVSYLRYRVQNNLSISKILRT